MGWQEDSWGIQLVLHSVLMRLEHQKGARTVHPWGWSTNFGHSRGLPFHHTAQLVEQDNPGHSLDNLLDPRWTVVLAQGALYAL